MTQQRGVSWGRGSGTGNSHGNSFSNGPDSLWGSWEMRELIAAQVTIYDMP